VIWRSRDEGRSSHRSSRNRPRWSRRPHTSGETFTSLSRRMATSKMKPRTKSHMDLLLDPRSHDVEENPSSWAAESWHRSATSRSGATRRAASRWTSGSVRGGRAVLLTIMGVARCGSLVGSHSRQRQVG
jgi:hypothetical protein